MVKSYPQLSQNSAPGSPVTEQLGQTCPAGAEVAGAGTSGAGASRSSDDAATSAGGPVGTAGASEPAEAGTDDPPIGDPHTSQ